jgi:hypothetical protein
MAPLRNFLPLRMRPALLALAWVACARPPITPATLIGEYVFVSADKGAPHDPDRLILRPEGQYQLVHMPHGHLGSHEDGTWRLDTLGREEILLGSTGLPIEYHGTTIRLLIDEDLGHWYEKIR